VSGDERNTPPPTLRVISGDATPEEIAAILALVTARAGADLAERVSAESASLWSTPSNGHRRSRTTFHAHRHGWRTSLWPR
jgi:acyl-CoA carboxylase epsilon subunit